MTNIDLSKPGNRVFFLFLGHSEAEIEQEYILQKGIKLDQSIKGWFAI